MRRARHAIAATAFVAFVLAATGCEREVRSPGAGAASIDLAGSASGVAVEAASSDPLARFADRHVAVVLGFTACPDVCPTTLWRWKQAVATLSDEQAGRFRLLFVTVDPERDTAAHLARYVAHFDPAFVGVRVEGETLEALLRRLRAHARKVPSSTPGEYAMDHTATAFVLGPGGVRRDEIRHGASPMEIGRRLRAVLGGPLGSAPVSGVSASSAAGPSS